MSIAHPTIVLASASPRRRDLIARLGLPTIARATLVDEETLEAAFTGPATELALHLAAHKADAMLATLQAEGAKPGRIILAADTTVVLDGTILGKPADALAAETMLARLRDREHLVVTGVVLVAAATGRRVARAMTTPVVMRPYCAAEVAAYIATGDPFDKAGSYAVQHPDFQPVARLDGCATNVIGLPLCVVAALLRELGVVVTPPGATGGPCPWDHRCARAEA